MSEGWKSYSMVIIGIIFLAGVLILINIISEAACNYSAVMTDVPQRWDTTLCEVQVLTTKGESIWIERKAYNEALFRESKEKQP